MALRQLSPLSEKQWRFVQKKLSEKPTHATKKIVEDLIKTGKKVKSLS